MSEAPSEVTPQAAARKTTRGALRTAGLGQHRQRDSARPGRCPMSASSPSPYERDFWSQACRLLDVGCGPPTLRMLLDPNTASHGIDTANTQPAPALVEITSCIAVPATTRPRATSRTLRSSGGTWPSISLSRGEFRPRTTLRADLLGHGSVSPSGNGVGRALRSAVSVSRSRRGARTVPSSPTSSSTFGRRRRLSRGPLQ
jgi:hypothetical protein